MHSRTKIYVLLSYFKLLQEYYYNMLLSDLQNIKKQYSKYINCINTTFITIKLPK